MQSEPQQSASMDPAARHIRAPSDLAWRVIGLLNLYRLLVPLVLLALHSFAGPGLGPRDRPPAALRCRLHRLFHRSGAPHHCAAASLVEPAHRRARQRQRRRASPSGFCCTLRAASRAALEFCWFSRCLALAVLADRRDAFLIAAVAALAVLMQQVFVGITDAAPASDYATAGLLGAVLFVIALATWPVAIRLRESDALVRRQEAGPRQPCAALPVHRAAPAREYPGDRRAGSHPPHQRVRRRDSRRRACLSGRPARRSLAPTPFSPRVMAPAGRRAAAARRPDFHRRGRRARDSPALCRRSAPATPGRCSFSSRTRA